MLSEQVISDLRVLSDSRVFFLRHSVGLNILNGIESLAAQAEVKAPRIVHAGEGPIPDGPLIAHLNGGRNTLPKSKVDAFRSTIGNRRDLDPDLALMKFCYVDFNRATDVDDLFSYYSSAMEELKEKFPDVIFAHVTVPLFERPTGIKDRIHRLIGREVWQDTANAKRHEFNRRLLETFAADPIFDLALIESTRPDGTRESYSLDGRVYYSLVPEYTDDGGHLNEAGQRRAAQKMVHVLAEALRKKREH